jgi:hypothetical protein
MEKGLEHAVRSNCDDGGFTKYRHRTDNMFSKKEPTRNLNVQHNAT